MIKMQFSNNNGKELISNGTIENVKYILDFYGYNYKVANFQSYEKMGCSEFEVKIFIKNPTSEDYGKLNFIFSGWSMMIICDGRYISDYEYDAENLNYIFPNYDRKDIIRWIKEECKRVNKNIDIDKRIKDDPELDYNIDEICSSTTVGQLVAGIRFLVSDLN